MSGYPITVPPHLIGAFLELQGQCEEVAEQYLVDKRQAIEDWYSSLPGVQEAKLSEDARSVNLRLSPQAELVEITIQKVKPEGAQS
jgi:hypothetical protein